MNTLSNGHQSDRPLPAAAVASNNPYLDQEKGDVRIAGAMKKAHVHPKQEHLNTLIHARIVTHLVHVDEVPDTLFALSQMQDLPEVRFAAIFDDGLIALGCPASLPEALATIAVPAVATSPARPRGSAGLQRIEQISQRLETLVDSMEPEEVILNDQLGRDILDRLTALEARMPDQHDKTAELAMSEMQAQLTALNTSLTDIGQHPSKDNQDGQLAQLCRTTKDIFRRVETMENGQLIGTLTDQITGLQRSIAEMAVPSAGRHAELEKDLKTIVRSMQVFLKTPPIPAQISEKIEQMGSAQRTAFARIETAMGKAVAGLAPALDHLNARAADTENMILESHKDLKSLSKRIQKMADSTGQLPPILSAVQKDVTALADKPAPVLDLTAQQEQFARFSSELRATLSDVEGMAQRADDNTTKAIAQSDQTIATLQTLPKLISATLRHDVDMTPIEQGIATLQSDLAALPNKMNFSAITADISALSDQIGPVSDTQKVKFDGLQTAIKDISSYLQTLGADVTRLHAKDPDLEPLMTLIEALQSQLTQSTQGRDVNLDLLKDMLADLTRHLGVTSRAGTQVVPSSPLVPDTSLNTLRMEFADLITKRMKENDTIFTQQTRQA